MKIKKKAVAAAIRREYKDLRAWCRGGWRRYGVIMIDTSDAEIWADCFLDSNSWTSYRSGSIKKVTPSYNGCKTVKERETAYINEAVKMLQDAGWSIE